MRTVAVLALLIPIGAMAQPQIKREPLPPLSAPAKPTTSQTPIKSELDRVFNELVEHLKNIDQLAAKLKEVGKMTPEEAGRQVDAAASTLGTLADRLQPQSDLAGHLKALRNSASVHRQRVQQLPKDAVEESDRTELLKSWDKVLQDADKTGAAMTTMRERLLGVLNKLRMRQAAVSEFVLAGHFKAAMESFNAWIADLNATIDSLHNLIDPTKPAS